MRVVELQEERAVAAPWLDPDGVARLLGVERDFVYEHATMLGVRRLGTGPKARLRFRLEDVEAALPSLRSKGSSSALPPAVKPKVSRQSQSGLGTKVPLPIAGSSPPFRGSL